MNNLESLFYNGIMLHLCGRRRCREKGSSKDRGGEKACREHQLSKTQLTQGVLSLPIAVVRVRVPSAPLDGGQPPAPGAGKTAAYQHDFVRNICLNLYTLMVSMVTCHISAMLYTYSTVIITAYRNPQ